MPGIEASASLYERVFGNHARLSRDRFGTSRADFLICRRCRQVAAAVSDDESPRAVINVELLARASEQTRLARRAKSWMPASVRELVRSRP